MASLDDMCIKYLDRLGSDFPKAQDQLENKCRAGKATIEQVHRLFREASEKLAARLPGGAGAVNRALRPLQLELLLRLFNDLMLNRETA
jgi:hypothetical protein